MATDERPPEVHSTAAAVLRELIRTPPVKQLIASALLEARDPELAGEAVRTLLSEDAEVSLSAAAAAPHLVSAAARAAAELGRALERFPPPMLASFVTRLAREVDHDELAQAAAVWGGVLGELARDPVSRRELARALAAGGNALLRWLAQRERQQQTSLLGPTTELTRELCGELDFGLVREATEALCASANQALPALVERAAADPVLLANLIESLPPLVNSLVLLGGRTLASLQLPPEVAASALFNLLGELDTAGLAALLDGLFGLVQAAHEGNLVMGRHEPAFRAVLGRFLGDLTTQIDRQAAAGAALALAEDLETAIRSAGDVLYTDPELLQLLLSTALASLRVVLEGATGAAEKLGQLPADKVEPLAQGISLDAEPVGVAAAEALNAAARLLQRTLSARPGLPRASFEALWANLDLELLWGVAGQLVAPALAAARDRLAALPPERLGQLAGRAMAAAAVSLERRPALLREALAGLDAPQTRRALESVLSQLGHSLGERPELLGAVARPIWAGIQQLVLGFVRGLPARLRSRREETR